MRGDAGHRKGRATRSESSEKTQALSPLGRVGGRQQALEMTRIVPGSTCGSLPTRRDPGAIPMGQYHQDLVLSAERAKTRTRRAATPQPRMSTFSGKPGPSDGGLFRLKLAKRRRATARVTTS